MVSIKHNVADVIWRSPSAPMEVEEFRFEHTISDIPLLRVLLKSEDHSLLPKDLVNQQAHLDLMCGEMLTTPRNFKGIITRFAQKRTTYGNIKKASRPKVLYECDIRPKFWLLTKRVNTRVFRQLNVKDIVSSVLDEHGVTFQWKLNDTHIVRDHCVQYQESDYQFVSRLIEDEGIYFHFDYPMDTVIFVDNMSAHTDCTPTAKLDYSEEKTMHQAFGSFERVHDVTYEEVIGTGKFTVDHYNYESSQMALKKDDSEGSPPQFPSLERYEHTLDYLDLGRGTFYAKVRKEEETAGIKVIHGLSSGRSIHVGFLMTMAKHFHGALNRAWLITRVVIEFNQGRAMTWFDGFETEKPFRPARKTERPQVFGVQTAVVTGPSGAKVYLDNLGRCKLQFHWDREGMKDEKSSMWVRVSNNYAGKDYGIQWIPRIGHEVLVSFVDGNPDLPVVTGRVYNDLNKPPLGPGEKWQNIIKTIKDNHILFDDVDDGERIDIRAQKDMSTTVLNNESYSIGNDKSINVKHDHGETIGNDMTLDVGRDLTESVGRNQVLNVAGDRTTSIGKSHTLTIGKGSSVEISDNYSTQVGKAYDLSVSKAGAMDIGKNLTLQVGDNYSMKVSKKTSMDSGDQIKITSGSATVTIKKSGDITIKGTKITVKGSGKVTLKGSSISVN